MLIYNENTRILLAGVTGNLGGFIYNSFQNKDNIYLIGRSKSELKNYYKLDFEDSNELVLFFEKSKHFDTLIFFIGLAHTKGNSNTFSNHQYTNYEILKNILESAEKTKKVPNKIIYASTISVYGESYNTEDYNENSALNPQSPYAITKKNSEELLLKKYEHKSWLLRFGPVYSKNFMLNINRRTKFFKVPFKVGSGDKKISLCNIKNIGVTIDGILKNKIPADTYNLVDKLGYTYNDLLKLNSNRYVLIIPKFIVQFIYICSKKLNLVSLNENAVKLLTNNTYSSKKLQRFIVLPFSLKDLN